MVEPRAVAAQTDLQSLQTRFTHPYDPSLPQRSSTHAKDRMETLALAKRYEQH